MKVIMGIVMFLMRMSQQMLVDYEDFKTSG